jgi:hypothetical protein
LGLAQMRPPVLAGGLLALIAGLSALTLHEYYQSEKEDWRSVAQHMAAEAGPDDAVLFYAGFVEIPYEFYMERRTDGPAPQTRSQVRPESNGSLPEGLVEQVRFTHETVWLVLSHASNGQVTDELRATLSQGYETVEETEFTKIQVVQYTDRTGLLEVGDEFIYDDQLRWVNWSWGTTLDTQATTPVLQGSNSIAVTFNRGWAAASFHGGRYFNTSPYDELRFAIHPAGDLIPTLEVALYDHADSVIGSVDPRNYARNAGNGWHLVTIPLQDLNTEERVVARIQIQEYAGEIPPTFHLDMLSFFGKDGEASPPLAGR